MLAALALIGGGASLRAQTPERNYGKTPDSVIPFRDFREPYARFFQEVTEFRGVGRGYADADLTTAPTVRIGFFGPTGSAPDADLGARMLAGVRLAVEQANATGGYRGVPFELVEREDTGLWGASSNEMVAFRYDDDVLAVIGSLDGANTHIALRVALKTQMPMVNTATTDPTLTETNIPWLLRCMADDRQQGYALAHHIFAKCGIEKVVAFRSNDRFGRMGIGEFRDAARRLKHPLLVELRWDPGATDFTAQLNRIAAVKPDAIVLWGTAADTASVVREIRRRKMPVRIFGCDRVASADFLTAAGPSADGVVAVATFDPTRNDPKLAAFAEHLALDAFAAHAYDGANIVINAICTAGRNRIRIRDALTATTHHDGVTGPIDFDTTLNDIGPVYIATVQDGAFVYEKSDFADSGRSASVRTPSPNPANKRDAQRWVESTARRPYRSMTQSPPVVRSPTDAPVVNNDVIKIGCFLALDAEGRDIAHSVRNALGAPLAPGSAGGHSPTPRIELIVRDARSPWGADTSSLVDLVFKDNVQAIICSTDRRTTHLAEMLAAKMHFPVITLCPGDSTITSIPLPWVFNLATASSASPPTDLAYDAGAIIARAVRSGAVTAAAIRDRLAHRSPYPGSSGTIDFDALGNRIPDDLPDSRPGDSPIQRDLNAGGGGGASPVAALAPDETGLQRPSAVAIVIK